jgi:hypothetical protein
VETEDDGERPLLADADPDEVAEVEARSKARRNGVGQDIATRPGAVHGEVGEPGRVGA